jgi:hypothetical protein
LACHKSNLGHHIFHHVYTNFELPKRCFVSCMWARS